MKSNTPINYDELYKITFDKTVEEQILWIKNLLTKESRLSQRITLLHQIIDSLEHKKEKLSGKRKCHIFHFDEAYNLIYTHFENAKHDEGISPISDFVNIDLPGLKKKTVSLKKTAPKFHTLKPDKIIEHFACYDAFHYLIVRVRNGIHWRNASKDEIIAHLENKTFTPTDGLWRVNIVTNDESSVNNKKKHEPEIQPNTTSYAIAINYLAEAGCENIRADKAGFRKYFEKHYVLKHENDKTPDSAYSNLSRVLRGAKFNMATLLGAKKIISQHNCPAAIKSVDDLIRKHNTRKD